MTYEEAREFVERWRKAGPELEKVRREELRALTDAESRRLFNALLELRNLRPQHRPTSGFVEQQRIFQKARR
jgi:hypothetical protein